MPLLANLSDRAGMMVSPKAAGEKAGEFAADRSAPGPTSSSSASRATSSASRNIPATGTPDSIGYDEIVYSYMPELDRAAVAGARRRSRPRRTHRADRPQDRAR